MHWLVAFDALVVVVCALGMGRYANRGEWIAVAMWAIAFLMNAAVAAIDITAYL